MGDLMNNNVIFKKLGFDSSNLWIFYDEQFQKFFSYFAENITDANILSDQECLEYSTMKTCGELVSDEEVKRKLLELQRDFPGLLEYKDMEINILNEEIKDLEKADDMYATLVEDMRMNKSRINCELTDLESNISELINFEKSALTDCLEKSKELQEIQKESRLLCVEANECFTKTHSPPLFVCQLQLEKYFLKCDSFLQYIMLYLTENFKIEDYLGSHDDTDVKDKAEAMQELQKLHIHYNELLIKEGEKATCTQAMIDCLPADANQIHIMSLSDMKKETRELHAMNQTLNITYETLSTNLLLHLQQRVQQQMELILYENTKEKLNRACLRKAKAERLSHIVSDALTNTELLWITIQLDLVKIRNRHDNTEQLNSETQKCLRRINVMKNLQNSPLSSNTFDNFILKMSDNLSQYLNLKVRPTLKACLYEFEKFCRLLKYAMQNVVNKRFYSTILDYLHQIDQTEQILKPLVYDSPVQAPKFENVNILERIYDAREMQRIIDKRIRTLRVDFHENISERMIKDKFWRYRQLLWIWFLTEPNRVIQAIEEVKKAGAKNPPITGIKSFTGIKRK